MNKQRKNYILPQSAIQKLEQLQGNCYLTKSQIITIALDCLTVSKLKKVCKY